MVAIVSLLIIIIITLSILITRVASIALVHTGLSKDSVSFQARSAFTGVGFTTNEAEQVVNHPVRRKILYTLMFLGGVGIISAISSLILSFMSLDRAGWLSTNVLVLFMGLAVLWGLARSRWIDRKLSYLIDRALSRYTRLDIEVVGVFRTAFQVLLVCFFRQPAGNDDLAEHLQSKSVLAGYYKSL